MFSINKFLSLIAIFASACMFVACSSSTSSSGGSGQIPTGQYTGNMNGQIRASTSQGGAVSTRIILNVVTAVENGAITTISGNMVVTGGDRCWTGGTINGVVNNNNNNNNNNDNDPIAGLNSIQQFIASSILSIVPTVHAQSSVNGNQMILDITTNDGETLSMIGRVTDDSYSGTFNVSDSLCGAVSGGFDLRRV